MVISLFQKVGKPFLDLFASEKNYQLPVFYSRNSSQSSSGVNALTQNWDGLWGYAYPPIAIIPRVLRKLRKHPTATVILIAPFWPSQIWFRQMTELLVGFPDRLPVKRNLLKNSETGELYPSPETLRLTAWLLSAGLSKRKAFRRTLLQRQRDPDGLRPEGFIMPVWSSTVSGAATGTWIPIRPL